MIKELSPGELYSNEEIFTALKVGNAGGIRLSIQDKSVIRAAIMTSVQEFQSASENPYRDRIEGNVLTYTAMGKVGEQTLGGLNQRIIEQKDLLFPIHGFVSIASRRDKNVGRKRWQYLGMLEYRRHYLDMQLDSQGTVRSVWIFEFEIHARAETVPIDLDALVARDILGKSRAAVSDLDDTVVDDGGDQRMEDFEKVEHVRGRLLAMEPRQFEFFVKDILVHCGFRDVCVTKFSSDGGVDVNAKVGRNIWMFENTVIQVQAKRWLHSVGRKEIAELRGSLQPFAKGAVLTTGHFSRAAMIEAREEGKHPITLVDGFRLSKLVLDERFALS